MACVEFVFCPTQLLASGGVPGYICAWRHTYIVCEITRKNREAILATSQLKIHSIKHLNLSIEYLNFLKPGFRGCDQHYFRNHIYNASKESLTKSHGNLCSVV